MVTWSRILLSNPICPLSVPNSLVQTQVIFLVDISLFVGKVIIFSSPKYILPSRQASLSTVFQSWGDIHLATKASTSDTVYGAVGPYEAQSCLSSLIIFIGIGSQWGALPPLLPSNIMGKQASRWGSNSSSGLERILLRETPSGGPLPP